MLPSYVVGTLFLAAIFQAISRIKCKKNYRFITTYLSPLCDEINFCCFVCVTQRWALHVVIKRQFFTFYICCFSFSIHSWDTTTSAFRQQANAIWKFYIRFWCWTFYRHLHVILQGWNKFCLNWTVTEKVMTLCRFFKMAAISSQIFFCFLVSWHLAFRKAKNYLRIKFRPDISIRGKLLRILVAEDKPPPYLNSTPGFDELFTVIGMWFCTGLPNFMQIGWSPTELWRHIDFTRWRP